jgi:hypothetical protein
MIASTTADDLKQLQLDGSLPIRPVTPRGLAGRGGGVRILLRPQGRSRELDGRPEHCARGTRSGRPAPAGRSMGSEGVLGKHVFWGLRPARRWCAGFCGPGIVSWIIDRLD